MKIVVIGSGAREHSLCYSISRSPLVSSIYAIPGNYGISPVSYTHLTLPTTPYV